MTVCDVAVDRYRQRLAPRFGAAVVFTHVDYQGTRVECVDRDRLPEFETEVRRLMAEPVEELG